MHRNAALTLGAADEQIDQCKGHASSLRENALWKEPVDADGYAG